MKTRLHLHKSIATFSILLLPTFLLAQGTLTITFDGPPSQPTNSQYGVTQYYESGMYFLPGSSDFDGQFERNGGGLAPVYPFDGSAYLQTGAGESLSFGFSSGANFNIVSVDLAGYSYLVPDFTVDFVGYHPDGSSITSSFSGTGLNFQTYYFGAGWSDLTTVNITSSVWSLDNLVVTVPEPNQQALFTLGGLVFSFWLAKRRRA